MLQVTIVSSSSSLCPFCPSLLKSTLDMRGSDQAKVFQMLPSHLKIQSVNWISQRLGHRDMDIHTAGHTQDPQTAMSPPPRGLVEAEGHQCSTQRSVHSKARAHS